MARPASGWAAPVGLAAVVVAVDQLTKHWALNALADDRIIDVVWTLRWNLAFNRGMAFSQAEGFGPLIAIVATGVIVWLLLSLRTMGGWLNTVGMGLVIGGAAGNLVDRAFRNDAWLRGGVVDFIDFQWFPIFNVADMAINVGAAALILNALLMARRDPDDPDPGDETAPAPDPEPASSDPEPASSDSASPDPVPDSEPSDPASPEPAS